MEENCLISLKWKIQDVLILPLFTWPFRDSSADRETVQIYERNKNASQKRITLPFNVYAK